MKKERFREEQIVRILKEAETGRMPIVEICRKYGISEFTFYRWRRKDQGLSISEARRLRELEKENQRLKRLLAQRDLEIDAIRLKRRMRAAVVIEVLREAFRRYGAPAYLRSDNGPEFTAEAMQSCLAGQRRVRDVGRGQGYNRTVATRV